MANWQRTLELSDVYHHDKPICELSGIVADRLRKIKVPDDEDALADQQEEIASDFEMLAKDPKATANEFDEIMSELYDWADTPFDDGWPCRRLCWVNTR